MSAWLASLLPFHDYPVVVNLGLFAIAAGAVWVAGSRLSRYAHTISDRTKLDEALAGLVLLGGATSLPELATTLSAAGIGNGELAVSNLAGGVAMQTAALALTDLLVERRSLTFHARSRPLVGQAVLLIVLLVMLMAAGLVGEWIVVGHVGLWPVTMVGAYLIGVYLLRGRGDGLPEPAHDPVDAAEERVFREKLKERHGEWSNGRLYVSFGVAAVVVAGAGWLVARTGDALAEQTGLGSSFVGATLVALATSLPEISTTITAARLGAYSMAVANIFGSNSIDLLLMMPADVVYLDGPIVGSVQGAVVAAAGLGIVLTLIYIGGLSARRDRWVVRMGWDSVAVLVMYGVGVWVFYRMR